MSPWGDSSGVGGRTGAGARGSASSAASAERTRETLELLQELPNGWVTVRWEASGHENRYRWGADGQFELDLVFAAVPPIAVGEYVYHLSTAVESELAYRSSSSFASSAAAAAAAAPPGGVAAGLELMPPGVGAAEGGAGGAGGQPDSMLAAIRRGQEQGLVTRLLDATHVEVGWMHEEGTR